jgi:tetratricopeptide (TPR) repeat protein
MAVVSVAVVGFGVLTPVAVVAQGVTDRVRLERGSKTGEITAMTPTELTLQQSGGRTERVAVNEIRSVVFDGEPAELTQARLHAKNGGYATALERIEQIDRQKIKREQIRDDVDFYLAFCAGKQALGGQGEITDAGRKLNDFVRSHPQNFHYLEAVELMGDLLMASEKFPAAERQYAELAKAPWPEYKTRADVLLARSLQAQGKHEEAIAKYDAVLAIAADDDSKRTATLGKAVSLAETDRLDEAVRMIEEVVQAADPEQKELQARAYNALGDCYQRAGRTKDALLAYLHVDVLYSTVPEAHAEALAHLAPLWEAVGQDARAREARQTLQDRYSGSRWAR